MISEMAYIHQDAKLGAKVKVEPFASIHNDVIIGDGCHIMSGAVIFQGARIGKNVTVYPGAVISAVPQDLKYEGEETITEIGDDTTIREYVTINKGTKALGKTAVGNGTLLMAYVHVAHDCVVGSHCILANGVTLAGHITIDDHAIIGGLTAVHQFVHIGSHVMISGASKVLKDVPPFVKAARDPLSYAGINSIGLKRRGFTTDQINTIQDVYRLLYVKGGNVQKSIINIEQEVNPSSERDVILEFVKKSSRGIMKGFSSMDMDDLVS
ncbi:MAG TPA: acyl-ACP--UDP-N-acetylglucosamine O-acyltransferase [Bacteroidia bacterium]|nr:acyl-ACP--UDP-N-acetylglucosamine O-acyltransferase [Bacteroidia bacterium]HNT80421.1 acyl-ACP--UDP-N-acetylglucosamine O-acyltransferase [Bacteroidia bacterium]